MCHENSQKVGEQKRQKDSLIYLFNFESLGIQSGSMLISIYFQGGSSTPEYPASQVSSPGSMQILQKSRPSSFSLIKPVVLEGRPRGEASPATAG